MLIAIVQSGEYLESASDCAYPDGRAALKELRRNEATPARFLNQVPKTGRGPARRSRV